MSGKLGLCRRLQECQAGEVESTPLGRSQGQGPCILTCREPLRLPGGVNPARAPPRSS